MKKHCLLLFTTLIFCSCSQTKTTKPSNIQSNSVVNQPANNSNQVLPSVNQNVDQNQSSKTNSSESLELMKQIENQQRESANQAKPTNKNGAVSPSRPTTGKSQRQTF